MAGRLSPQRKMARIRYGTTYIMEDEPCIGLSEMNLQSPNNRGWRRYQIIFVMRGDKPAEFRKDMGLAKKFKGVHPIRILGGVMDEVTGRYYVEHNVGELRDMADDMRANPPFDLRELAQVDRIRQ